MFLRKPMDPEQEKQEKLRGELVDEIKRIRKKLDQNERYFNMICDFDMTEANIHEHNALQLRYRYYLGLIREYDRGHRTAEHTAQQDPAAII